MSIQVSSFNLILDLLEFPSRADVQDAISQATICQVGMKTMEAPSLHNLLHIITVELACQYSTVGSPKNWLMAYWYRSHFWELILTEWWPANTVTIVHFVYRCIRPNDMKSPDLFQPDRVLLQLCYTGVMETTRIRKEVGHWRVNYSKWLKG